ncbi:hypothetical protein J1N35_043061 [Gossypium stocksii]|uniref:Uncharacterized protein n=1 Tax=Gossypium stocksii TaxID=47602 RepID=A0A9D3U6R1_9ROSI|nr:hypothetical protein J1N35_043061 [Gossypium stocksii]
MHVQQLEPSRIKLTQLEQELQRARPQLLECMDRERVGTSSRQKQKFTHTAGSRSFGCVAEAEEVLSGRKVGRLQRFDITHRKKNGSPMTSEAGEIMIYLEKLNERRSPERYGRVRFQGSSVTQTQYFGSSSQQYMPSGSQAQAEVQRLKDQIAQMQARTVEQIAEQQLIADAIEREAAVAAYEAEQSKKYDEL